MLFFLFFFSLQAPKPSVPSHLWPRLFFIEFQICLELTKHNIWISIQEGRLIWKLFNAPGPQWDQIEEQFLWAECKWIRNMWIKFLLNLKGNLNIKEKCFAMASWLLTKSGTWKKELAMTIESKICPVFFSFTEKDIFDLCIKENRTMDGKLLLQQHFIFAVLF